MNLLASHGVNALIAAGMGSRPLAGFNDVGITVYFENATPGIGDAVKLVLDGSPQAVDARPRGVIRADKAGGGNPFVLAIASGKGGTGKAPVATNVAVLAAASGLRVAVADCDVEAPNDHLFLHGAMKSTSPVEVPVAEVDTAACTACGRCRDACAYGAARILGASAIVFDELCKGCGLLARASSDSARSTSSLAISARPRSSHCKGRRGGLRAGTREGPHLGVRAASARHTGRSGHRCPALRASTACPAVVVPSI